MNALVSSHHAGPHRRHTDLQVVLHPDMFRRYVLYVVPLAMIPPITLLHCWNLHHATRWPALSLEQISTMAVVLFLAALLLLPLMVRHVQARRTPEQVSRAFDEAFALSAIAPALLWLTPLMLLVPALAVSGVLAAIAATALLLYLGTCGLFQVQFDDARRQLCWSVVAGTLGVWLCLIVLALFGWNTPGA